MGYIVKWKSDLVNTNESILPVCDEPYYTNKRKAQKGEEIEDLWSCALNINIEVTIYSACNIITLLDQNK